MSENPYQAPQSARGGLQLGDEPLVFAQTPQQRNGGPEGIGGWLILLIVGLVSTVLSNLMATVAALRLIGDGSWAAVTTPGNALYHPLFGTLLTFELIGNAAFALYAIVMLVLMFTKSPWFPRGMIAMYVASVLYLVGDLVIGMQVPSVAAEPSGSIAALARSAAVALIWIPYLLTSKRVRNTFVHKPGITPHARREPRWDATPATEDAVS